MGQLELVIQGKPVPQGRPLVTRYGTFDPNKDIKNWHRIQFAEQMKEKNQELILEPIELFVAFFMPIPKTTSKKKQLEMEQNIIKHTKRPDIDNCYKIFDSMNEIVFKDDSQIWFLELSKVYSLDPRTEITLIW